MARAVRDGARAAWDKAGAAGMVQELLVLLSILTCVSCIGTLMRGNRE